MLLHNHLSRIFRDHNSSLSLFWGGWGNLSPPGRNWGSGRHPRLSQYLETIVAQQVLMECLVQDTFITSSSSCQKLLPGWSKLERSEASNGVLSPLSPSTQPPSATWGKVERKSCMCVNLSHLGNNDELRHNQFSVFQLVGQPHTAKGSLSKIFANTVQMF